jgi:hypothetical protein
VRETAVESALRRACKRAGFWCLKLTVLGRRGFPDRLILCPGGRVRFVECKRPDAFARASQKLVHSAMKRLGFFVCVVDTPEQALEVVAQWVAADAAEGQAS